MSAIEKVRVLKTLKLGDTIFLRGEILTAPLPAEIHKEIQLGDGTVIEVLQVAPPAVPSPVQIGEEKKEETPQVVESEESPEDEIPTVDEEEQEEESTDETPFKRTSKLISRWGR